MENKKNVTNNEIANEAVNNVPEKKEQASQVDNVPENVEMAQKEEPKTDFWDLPVVKTVVKIGKLAIGGLLIITGIVVAEQIGEAVGTRKGYNMADNDSANDLDQVMNMVEEDKEEKEVIE